jgi:hypothetical protein
MVVVRSHQRAACYSAISYLSTSRGRIYCCKSPSSGFACAFLDMTTLHLQDSDLCALNAAENATLYPTYYGSYDATHVLSTLIPGLDVLKVPAETLTSLMSASPHQIAWRLVRSTDRLENIQSCESLWFQRLRTVLASCLATREWGLLAARP